VCLKHLHVIARREGIKERECECTKEEESLCQRMCNFVGVCVSVCVYVHACMWSFVNSS